MQETVSFQIDPNDFGDALSEAQRDMQLSSGVLFVCAVDGQDSDLFYQQACAPAEEIETDQRVILGLEGEGQSHTFVDIPAQEVAQEGMFVLGRVDELTAWASKAEGYTWMTYEGDGMEHHLRVDYPNGHDTIDIKLFYETGRFDRFFASFQNRFTSPETSAYNEPLSEMLRQGSSIAPTGDRTGDLVFEDGTAKFVTRQRLDRMVVATSQTCDLEGDYPLSDFRWEITSDQLTKLRRVAGNEGATMSTYSETNERTENEYEVIQMAYSVDASSGESMYVQHRTSGYNENPPIHDWSGQEAIFGSDHCKLFGSVQTDALNQRLSTTWALKPNKVIQAYPSQYEDGSPAMILTTHGSGEDNVSDQKDLPMTPGDSAVDHYLFMPGAHSIVEKIVGEAQMMQIRSFPANGQEQSNGYVIVPLEEDTDPGARPTDPERYMIITWQDQ